MIITPKRPRNNRAGSRISQLVPYMLKGKGGERCTRNLPVYQLDSGLLYKLGGKFRKSQPHSFMPHLLLAPFRSMAARVMVCAVLCGAVAGCSSTTGGGGATTGYLGYVFAEDFELERRYLHLPKTPEFITRCLYQDLPPSDNVEWKEMQLDPGVHRAVVLLLEDPDNAEHFESDTVAFEEVEPRVCLARPGDIDFCYAPAMLASTVTTPIFIWQFGLTPEFTLSMQSQELIDAFLAAHDECWQNGAPAPGYGGNP